MPTPTLNIGFNVGPPTLQGSHGQFGILEPQVALNQSGTTSSLTYPLIATSPIGGSQAATYVTSPFQLWAGKHDWVNHAWYIGIEPMSGGATLSSVFAAEISNGASLGVTSHPGLYLMQQNIATAYNNGGNSDTEHALINWANANNVWLRSSWPSGSIVAGDASTDGYINSSINGPVDGNGRDVNAFWSYYGYNVIIAGNAVSLFSESSNIAANSNCKHISMDNQFWVGRSAGSWLWTTTSYNPSGQSGTIYSPLQKGYASLLGHFRTLAPNLLLGGNIDYAGDYYGAGFSGGADAQIDPSCVGLYDFPFSEAVIGQSYSLQTNYTFAQVMTAMIASEQWWNSNGLGFPIFSQEGRKSGVAFTSVPQSNWVAADWQSARLGMTMAWLRGWAIHIMSNGNNNASDELWFDEYDGGGTRLKWLGQFTDPPQTSAQFPNGVWGRHAQNGLVLCNPYGNGSQTVTLTSGVYWTIPFNGYSDSSVNTNSQVNSVTIPDGTGIVLSVGQL